MYERCVGRTRVEQSSELGINGETYRFATQGVMAGEPLEHIRRVVINESDALADKIDL